MSTDINCMPSGLVDRAGLTNCPTTYRLLASLAIYNAMAALLSLFFGHNYIRAKISLSCTSNRWTPLAAIITSLVHVAAMVVSTYTLRSNGFQPNFFMLFGLWSMRPRGGFSTAIWWFLSSMCTPGSENAYHWTLKDNIMEDTLLNIFALPFALWYILNRPSAVDEPECASLSAYTRFWNSFYGIAGVGGVSLFVLIWMLIHFCKRPRNKSSSNAVEGMSRFWKGTLIISTINMFAACATAWIIWSTFVMDAGSDFCPGELVGQGFAWGIAVFLNALIRPIVGGAP